MDYVLRVDSGAMVARSGEPDMSEDDLRVVEELASARRQILDQIEKRVVGQREVIDHLLISLFSRGHCLFVGVPGLAKTLLISTLAEVLNLTFNRVQFTPDLMPSDITGTDILEEDRTTGRRKLRFMRGPIFANIILADEVNRTPPKTQAALLQAMQEYRVTASGQTYPLDLPFLVFATQNPIAQEGALPRKNHGFARPGAARSGAGPRRPVCGRARSKHPSQGAQRSGIHPEERRLGRRSPGQPISSDRREGASGAQWTLRRF